MDITHLHLIFAKSADIVLKICGFTASTTYSQTDVTSLLSFVNGTSLYGALMLGVDIKISLDGFGI